MSDDPTAEEMKRELEEERAYGKTAARSLVYHLIEMGAARATIPIEVDGITYTVCAFEASVSDPQAARLSALEAENAGLRAQLAEAKKVNRECHTCDGGGLMMVPCGYDNEGNEGDVVPVTCAECCGTGVSSWGQAIDEAAALRAEVEALRIQLTEATPILAEHAAAVSVLAASPVGDLDFVESIEALVAQLAAPLRLGRGPTGDEVKQHGVGVGLWLVHFAGDAPDRWHVVCFRAIDDEDARPTDFEIDEVGWTDIAVDYDDAIPLDSNRQPCPVGGGRGTL